MRGDFRRQIRQRADDDRAQQPLQCTLHGGSASAVLREQGDLHAPVACATGRGGVVVHGLALGAALGVALAAVFLQWRTMSPTPTFAEARRIQASDRVYGMLAIVVLALTFGAVTWWLNSMV